MTGKDMAMGDTGALGAATMRAKAAAICSDEVFGRFTGPAPAAFQMGAHIQAAILAIPLPAPADLLAAARELPEVANAISVMQMVLSAMKAADLHYHNTVLADALDAALRAIGGAT